MFSKVLIATDLSPASEGVLHCIKGLIPLGTKKAILVHAIGIQHLETMVHGMAHFLEPHLVKQKAVLEEQGFETEIVLALYSATPRCGKSGGHSSSPVSPGLCRRTRCRRPA